MEQLYDLLGQRKYLTQHERDRFLKAAQSASTPVRAVSENSGLHRLSDIRGPRPHYRSDRLRGGCPLGRGRLPGDECVQ